MDLDDIKELIVRKQYEVSEKVQDLLDQEYFEKRDLENCLQTAHRIHKKQRDEKGVAVDGMKYVIIGMDTHGQSFYTAGKVVKDHLGHLYFFITAHHADE